MSIKIRYISLIGLFILVGVAILSQVQLHKQYVNSEYKFQFDYPSGWSIGSKGPTSFFLIDTTDPSLVTAEEFPYSSTTPQSIADRLRHGHIISLDIDYAHLSQIGSDAVHCAGDCPATTTVAHVSIAGIDSLRISEGGTGASIRYYIPVPTPMRPDAVLDIIDPSNGDALRVILRSFKRI